MTDPMDPNSAPQPEAGPAPYPYAYTWPPPQPPPPSHARRNALIVLAVVLVLAAGGVGGYFALRGSGSSARLSLPNSFAGFSREQDATSSRVERTMRGMGAGAGGVEKRLFDAAAIAVYQEDTDVAARLIVFALPTSSVPRGQGTSPSAITAGLLEYMGSGSAEQPAGPHGGSMRCCATSIGAIRETACAWSDSATTGMLVSAGTPLSMGRLSAVGQALRDRVD